jgi:phosphoribosylamine--glycine ligase
MKILVIGNGAREHALVWKLSQSSLVEKIYCAPGNPGIMQFAQCVDISNDNLPGLLKFARKEKIDLTVPGPEAPLVAGIVDEFEAQGVAIFGPTREAAALEGSKAFAKFIMEKYNIPTAKWAVFQSYDEAHDFVGNVDFPCVIKADGLAAGKGAIIVRDMDEAKEALRHIMLERAFGEAGDKVVIEEFMRGEEASVFAISDGEDYILLPASQDHKAIFDGDKGPNTGGMGAYAPAPLVTDGLMEKIRQEIMTPALQAMANEGTPFRGVLYAGLMITKSGPKVVEFNCRFGDPEAQVVLPLIKSDFADMMHKAATRSLKSYDLQLDRKWAVCVVMASGGYPGAYKTGKNIIGLDYDFGDEAIVFHAGTKKAKDGQVVTAGGRVLSATAFSNSFQAARQKAYDMIQKITFDGAYYRKDIGAKTLNKFNLLK